jgi:hypothetical protein
MSVGAAAAAAAIAQAIKASGAIVSVEPEDFMVLVERSIEPLIVKSLGGFFSSRHLYLMNYKGLFFFTKARLPLELPPDCEIIEAKKIWVPG